MKLRLIQSLFISLLWLLFAGVSYASAWTDYLEDARVLVAEDGKRLNLALQPQQAGEVKLAIEVRQTGEVSKAKIISSSGVDVFDQAALESIQQLDKLPTPPASVYFKQFFTPLTFVYVFDPALLPASQPVQAVIPDPEPAASSPEQDDGRQRSSEVVAAIQAELIEAGFDPGPVDGLYGRGTASAIRDYQRRQGLEQSGVPSAALLSDIRAFNRREIRTPASNQATPEPVDSATTELAEVAADPGDDGGETRQAPSSEVSRYSDITPPASGSFSVNRKIVEDYEYVEDRVREDHSSF